MSVHLSAALSGTVRGRHAGRAPSSTGAVEVVDARSTGMGLGFPALAARRGRGGGVALGRVRRRGVDAIDRTSTFFYVDTLEFLRRGGRINAASALLGTALSVKPILHVVDGAIVMRDQVRTAGRALARLVDLAVEAAGDVRCGRRGAPPGRARTGRDLTAALASRLDGRLREVYVTEIGAVVAAHVGPGLACVVVHRRP